MSCRFWNNIIYVDNNTEKIGILNKVQLPISESGLKKLKVRFCRSKKIIKGKYIFDLRYIYSKEIIAKENGFKYFSVGR